MSRRRERINGPALAVIRERSGYNQAAFARLAGVSRQYMCDLEAGRKTGNPEINHRIAQLLGVPLPAIVISEPVAPATKGAA